MPGMQRPLPSAPARNATPQEMIRLATGGYGRLQSQGSRFLLNVSAPNTAGAAAVPQGPPGRGEQAVRGTAPPPPPMGAQERMRRLGSSAALPLPRPVQPATPATLTLVETDLFGDDDAEALVRFFAWGGGGSNALTVRALPQAFARSVSQRVGGFSVPNPGGPRPLPKPLPTRAPGSPPHASGTGRAGAQALGAASRPPLSAHVPPQRPAAAAPKPAARPSQAGGAGKRSFADAFAAVTAGQDAARGSRHEDLALVEEERRTFAALDVLAKREGLHEAASKLTKMSVRVRFAVVALRFRV